MRERQLTVISDVAIYIHDSMYNAALHRDGVTFMAYASYTVKCFTVTHNHGWLALCSAVSWTSAPPPLPTTAGAE